MSFDRADDRRLVVLRDQARSSTLDTVMAKSLYVIDGYYQIYRAFYGIPQTLTSPSGEPTAATQVFFSMLLGLIRDRKPDYLAIAMDDRDEAVFRREIDPNYKAHRDPAPEELHIQADRIGSIITAMNVSVWRVPGFEADDVMATIVERLGAQDVDVYLVSRDKDLEQLIGDRVRLYDSKKGRVLDPEGLLSEKGYRPEQAVDLQTLVGDSTDNIPGVYGIGIKTAVRLLNQYGTAQAVLEHAAELTPKMSERVRAFAEQMPVTRQLVTLRRDVPMSFDLARCALDRIDFAAALPTLQELGFNRLPQQFSEMTGAAGFSLRDTPKSRAAGFSLREMPEHEDISIPEAVHQNTQAPASFAQAEACGSGSSGFAQAPATAGAHSAFGSARYELVDTVEALEAFVERLTEQTCVAFDTETTGLNPVAATLVGLSFCWCAGEAFYIPVQAAVGSILPLDVVVAKLKPIMEDAAVAKIGHNIKYDVVVLRQVGIQVNGISFDTMIAGFLLDPLRRSHSLDAMVQSLIGHRMIPITELIGKGKKQLTLDQLDTAVVSEYAAEDADYTWRLYELLAPQLFKSDVAPLFRDTEMPLVDVLAEMEHNGVTLDTELLAQLSETMGHRLTELTERIHHEAGHAFNIDSTKQLATVLFDEQRLSVVKKTKTGRSTDAETLTVLVGQTDHAIPKLVLEYRQLAKLKGTYVDTLPRMICRRTGRLHAGFNQTGAVTGRLSSSDPNLQNIPIRTAIGRRIRAAVTAKPDHVLIAADYSQIELRLLAHFSHDSKLVEAFRTGQDVHRTVAAQVNGVSIDEVTPEQRSAAKAVNFGIIYGQTAFGLARSLGIPSGAARTFIDAYFQRYPGIRGFIDQCVADARKAGYVRTILGRRRPVPELRSTNRQQVSLGERIAVNTVVQGSAADLIKRAMVDIHEDYRRGGHTARMLIQVHDELVFEVSETLVETEARLIGSKMEQALSLVVPVVVDIAWSRTWDTAK